MPASYTASLWTIITSSATIPVFSTSSYTLKGAITDRNHILPGNPFNYPTNLSIGQNLYCILTAPSGAREIQGLCISMSFDQDYYQYGCPGGNPWIIQASLRSGSCASSGSATWDYTSPLYIGWQAVDSNNNFYYGDMYINSGSSSVFQCVDVALGQNIATATAEYIQNLDPDKEVNVCGTCGQPNTVIYDVPYVIVSPASVTSSTFPAEILIVSGGNYGVKVSSSVDGQLANVDIGIGWVSSSNTPLYYTGSFGAVYWNTQISASVQKNDCTASVGTYVTYTLPVSTSFSTSSQLDAQNLAQAIFNANSQSYANTYGSCTNPIISFTNYYAGMFEFSTSIPAPADMTVTYAAVNGYSGSVCTVPSIESDYLSATLTISQSNTFGAQMGNYTMSCDSTVYKRYNGATICGTASLNDGDTFQFGGYTWEVEITPNCEYYAC